MCVLPYYPDLLERIEKIMRAARIGVPNVLHLLRAAREQRAHKPQHTIRGILTKLKDAIPVSDKSDVVFSTGYKDSGEAYVGK